MKDCSYAFHKLEWYGTIKKSLDKGIWILGSDYNCSNMERVILESLLN